MRHYEIVFLVHPDQSDQVSAMLGRYQELVAGSGGQVHRSEDWGRRQLAYLINDVHKAHYAMMNIECDLDTLREIESNFKFNDSIIRSLVIRRDEAISEESAMAKARAAEDKAEAERKATDSQRTKRDTSEAETPAKSDEVPESAEPAAASDDAKEDAAETAANESDSNSEPEEDK